jgi:hypothetical protein
MVAGTSPQPTQPTGWKHTALVPIIVTVITLFGGFLISSIASTIYKPDVSVELIPDKENIYRVTIDLKNKGYVAAKNLKLTMESPYNITSVDIFSTENYTKEYVNNSAILEVNVPRLVQGEGSIIRINALIDSHSNITGNDHYIVYSTYDQGSKMNAAYILATAGTTKIADPYQSLIDSITEWFSPISGVIVIISTIVGVIATLLQTLLRRTHKKMDKSTD